MLGNRLRRARTGKGLSLHQVELQTNGVFKASIVGAYERGERSISVRRLSMLVDLYGTTVARIIAPVSNTKTNADSGEGVRIHLPSVSNLPNRQRIVVQRFIDHIKQRRGDPASEVLTLRGEDLLTIACVLGVSEDVLSHTIQHGSVTS